MYCRTFKSAKTVKGTVLIIDRARTKRRLAPLIAVGAVALIVLGLAGYWQRHHALPQLHHFISGHDFGAFYCGAKVSLQHADPYRIEPLRQCEHSIQPPSAYFTPDVVEPVPLPPYAIALFTPFALFSFETALRAWLVVILVCVVVSAYALARITGFPWWVALAALLIPVGYVELYWGQLPALCIAVLCISALLLHSGRPAAAGAVVALSLITPHVGSPAVLALLCFVPRARVALLGSGAALAVVGLLFVGAQPTIEYLTRFLPLHALAEAQAQDQFSLTWLAFVLGVPDQLAVRLGELSYALAVVVGVFLAQRLACMSGEPAFTVLLPPALAVFGGVFVHDMQIAAAIPAALVLAAQPGQLRSAAFVALAMLSVSWVPFVVAGAVLVMQAIALAAIVWFAATSMPLTRRAVITVGAVAIYVTVLFLIGRVPERDVRLAGSPAAFSQIAAPNADLAPAQWGVTLRERHQWNHATLQSIAYKVPYWLALALLCGLSIRASLAPAGETRKAPGDRSVAMAAAGSGNG